MAEPKTNCIFRTFRVAESFWTKKQSCKFSKVDIMKCRPFCDSVCFNERHILKLRYLSRGRGKYLFSCFFPTIIWQRSIPTQILKRVLSQYFFPPIKCRRRILTLQNVWQRCSQYHAGIYIEIEYRAQARMRTNWEICTWASVLCHCHHHQKLMIFSLSALPS